jgi:hypothetical protein
MLLCRTLSRRWQGPKVLSYCIAPLLLDVMCSPFFGLLSWICKASKYSSFTPSSYITSSRNFHSSLSISYKAASWLQLSLLLYLYLIIFYLQKVFLGLPFELVALHFLDSRRSLRIREEWSGLLLYDSGQ